MEFAPGVSVVPHWTVSPAAPAEPFTTAGAPLQVTLATPENTSVALPTIDSIELKRLSPFVGDVSKKTGGARSSLTVADAVVVLPARSVDEPVTVWPALSVSITWSDGQEPTSMPDPASVHANAPSRGCCSNRSRSGVDRA